MNTTRRDLSWEGDEISLKVKLGYANLMNVGKREWIVFDVLDDEEGSKNFR